MYEKALSELGLFLQYVQNDKRAKDIKGVIKKIKSMIYPVLNYKWFDSEVRLLKVQPLV